MGIPKFERESERIFEVSGAEKEREPLARVSIDMARHSIKGAKPREALTQEGMDAAVQAGLSRQIQVDQINNLLGKVYGSPLERTAQSSVFRMFAEQFKDMDFSNVDPEDIVRWLEEGGLEKVETPFLQFQLGDGAYTDTMMDAFKKGEYFKWLVENSDRLAKEYKQKEVTPFSIQAGNIASFIFAKVWELYDGLSEKGTNFTESTLDFATSHQGVLESFLHKIIRKNDGEDVANEFVKELNGAGFSENQGFLVEIVIFSKDDSTAWGVNITYKDKKYYASSKDILQIMKEGEDLKEELLKT